MSKYSYKLIFRVESRICILYIIPFILNNAYKINSPIQSVINLSGHMFFSLKLQIFKIKNIEINFYSSDWLKMNSSPFNGNVVTLTYTVKIGLTKQYFWNDAQIGQLFFAYFLAISMIF